MPRRTFTAQELERIESSRRYFKKVHANAQRLLSIRRKTENMEEVPGIYELRIQRYEESIDQARPIVQRIDNPTEERVMELRYLEGKKLDETAAETNLSMSHVNYLERLGLLHLADYLPQSADSEEPILRGAYDD